MVEGMTMPKFKSRAWYEDQEQQINGEYIPINLIRPINIPTATNPLVFTAQEMELILQVLRLARKNMTDLMTWRGFLSYQGRKIWKALVKPRRLFGR
jgi:hypothetical protein